jgi:pyruvate dehydrogenase E2 component (dihydrolipoamide acetyltransferase)
VPSEILMPVITDFGDEGVVTAWFVDEGGRVEADQLIAEVQAEKVAQDVHAPGAGIVRGLVAFNEPVPQGSPICMLFGVNEAPAPIAATSDSAAEPPTAETSRVIASPSAKRVARELGVDLTTVTGTGPAGRITEADVRSALDPVEPGATDMGGLRAVIARNMRRSVQETAPVTLTTTADVTDTASSHITAWVVGAVAVALGDHHWLNGTREGDQFTVAETAHVAIAIQTEDGLVAPVVRDPAASSLEDIAAEISRLADRARSRELASTDYEGGTFTVTSLGSFGVDAFTPIINLPQVASLGVGALRTVPRFDEVGAVVPRRLMTLSLTFDHAFVDGAPAAEFLARVVELLEGET